MRTRGTARKRAIADPALESKLPERSRDLPAASRRKSADGQGRSSGKWVLYVLRCKDDTLYCGITNRLARRLEQHNQGKGARYTKGRGPVVLLKSWPAASHSSALRAEHAFKALRRDAKERKILSRSRSDEISRLLK